MKGHTPIFANLLGLLLACTAAAGQLPDSGEAVQVPESGEAVQVPDSGEAGRFIAVDLFIDPHGQPLGAYQVEISNPDGTAEIVGIEGGDHPAYSEPPFYDPAALSEHRIILAAFSTSPQLPRSDTRVASIHLRVDGDRDPELGLELEVSLAASGAAIQASAHLEGVGP